MASTSPGYSITVRVQAPPTVGATADLAGRRDWPPVAR